MKTKSLSEADPNWTQTVYSLGFSLFSREFLALGYICTFFEYSMSVSTLDNLVVSDKATPVVSQTFFKNCFNVIAQLAYSNARPTHQKHDIVFDLTLTLKGEELTVMFLTIR